jgi:asparagine synthetase B (glutamine-hydrolysing)
MRQQGMFIDLAGSIMQWRLNDGKGYPPIAQLVRYLRSRGWTGEQGGALSRTEVKRMLAIIDSNQKALPAHKAEWNHAMDNGFVVPDAEITTVAIDPEGWLEFRAAILDGRKPSWRDRTVSETDEEADTERLREALARPVAKRLRPDE